jgi:hypothetical protein
MFIAALFTTARLWKQPKCPTAGDWIKKMWYLYTTEYYLTIKKNEIMLFVGKWKELEVIMLSKGSEGQRSHVFPLWKLDL